MRILGRLAVVLGVLWLGVVVLGNMAEGWVIYPFDRREVAPIDVGLAGVSAQVVDVNGARLVVWSAAPKPGKPVIVYFHGNAGNLAGRAGRFQRFLDRGYGLIAPAYRGSSGSSGRASEDVLVEDAIAIFMDRIEVLGAEMAVPVVFYGESLGGAVAIALNSRLTAKLRADAIILEAPFTSIPALAEHHYPGTGDMAQKIDNTWHNLERAADLTPPLLVIHGTQDTLIPNDMGRQILAAAPSVEKQFFAVKNAGHTDLWRANTLPHLWQFIDAYALDLR